jgi:putative hemolysin
MNRKKVLGLIGLVLALPIGLAASSVAQAVQAGTSRAPMTDTTWCTQHGGRIVAYSAWYDINAPQPTPLGPPQTMCRFTRSSDSTMILVAADTLASQQPTMAELAYTYKPDASKRTTQDLNPATWYCELIGGTEQFGDSPADVGGWAPSSEAHPTEFIGMCVFADRSMIDEWGLDYHTHGIVRGADLAGKWRARLPAK